MIFRNPPPPKYCNKQIDLWKWNTWPVQGKYNVRKVISELYASLSQPDMGSIFHIKNQ